MSELKKFLRFEISGFIVILYAFLFIITFFDLNMIKHVFHTNILDFSIISLVIAAPIGFIMHEIDIVCFNPFNQEVKVWFWGGSFRRTAIYELNQYTTKYPIFNGRKPQMILEFLKCSSICSNNKEFNFKYFQKEISVRYSYYYARMEASVFSPIFGFIIFLIFATVYWFNSKNNQFIEINLERGTFFIIIVGFIFLLSRKIHSYCKTLIEEIDVLEYFFVNKYFKKSYFSNYSYKTP